MRTTIDIDKPILAELKRLRHESHRPMGRLVSDLLAGALSKERKRQKTACPFAWIERSMGARVDIADRDAVYDAMEGAPAP